MNILGISCFYHDSAACLVRDGEIIAAAQEERFSRKKHDPDFPIHAIKYCCNTGGIKAEGLDYIVFYEKPFIKFERILETYLMYAPGGIASLIMMNLRIAAFGRLREVWVGYLALAVTALLVLVGAAAMIEMVYHLQLNVVMGDQVRFLGAMLDAKSVDSWFGALFVMLTGLGMFEVARRHFVRQWGEIQACLERETKRSESP